MISLIRSRKPTAGTPENTTQKGKGETCTTNHQVLGGFQNISFQIGKLSFLRGDFCTFFHRKSPYCWITLYTNLGAFYHGKSVSNHHFGDLFFQPPNKQIWGKEHQWFWVSKKLPTPKATPPVEALKTSIQLPVAKTRSLLRHGQKPWLFQKFP